jgi:hypothetical protein
MDSNNGNIILNQLLFDGSSFAIKELIPSYAQSNNIQTLVKTPDNSIYWSCVDSSLNIIVNNRLLETDIYYDKGRVGLGRSPLFNYKVDIAVPANTLMTAFHIGDGSFGFSMGNGTTQGFVPEIIGIGSDENDTGLYFVGIAGNNVSSDIPLIILDGRNSFNRKLTNRPIFGVTSGNYNEYVFLIDASGDVKLNGVSILNIIAGLQAQIDELKTKIT